MKTGAVHKSSVIIIFIIIFPAGDETAEDRSQQKMERLKKRALSSSMMDELRRDHMDEPEEIVVSADRRAWGEELPVFSCPRLVLSPSD